MHPGAVAEKAEELEAESLAGMFLPGADVEGRREGSGGNDVGVHGPESEEVKLLRGAIEVLAIEIDDSAKQGAAIGVGNTGIVV